MIVNYFKCHSTAIGWHQVIYKKSCKWKLEVKCMSRIAWNGLLQAGLKSCKVRKKRLINEKQTRPRRRLAKDYKDWTIKNWIKVSSSWQRGVVIMLLLWVGMTSCSSGSEGVFFWKHFAVWPICNALSSSCNILLSTTRVPNTDSGFFIITLMLLLQKGAAKKNALAMTDW